MCRVGLATRSGGGVEEERREGEERNGTSNRVCIENTLSIDTSDQGAQDNIVSSEVICVGIETTTLCQSRSLERVHANGETKFVRHESEGT